ncbi:MAG: translocation/assembly module TamB domain-containing protein, partial [Bdellovibrionales bacterium]|jgi:translocation and assembly module TamB|nr:translocation/assembly module TamB domain-containing protein [Bdellovibrionales bacterium]
VTGTIANITLNIPDKIRTPGSGDFSVTGSWFPFLLIGDYTIQDGLMAKELGDDTGGGGSDELRRDQFLPRFLVEESFIPLVLDMNVDFTKGIRLKNEMIEGSATGKLQVAGNPTKPKIQGQIRTQQETKVNFRENIFDVTSALVSFEDPIEINPRINVNARTRVDGYDVNLIVQGTAKKPEISVSSVPPMPEADIFSLLALGTTDQKLSQRTGGQQQDSSASQQVISGVANRALKDVTAPLGVDVQLSPGFDDTNEAYQKVIIKKQFNRRLDVSGSQSLGKRSETEAKVRYRVTDRISGVLSWQGVDRGETSDSTGQQSRNLDKVGLDFEYKLEFK